MNWDKWINRIIEYSFYTLLFIVPLIFLPGHIELFQFNKIIVVYLITTIITSSWLLRMIVKGKFFLKRTPLDLPILLFLISQTISTLLSIEPHTSIWGYYSRFHGGLLSTIAYILLYYAFISNGWENTGSKGENQSYTWVKRSIISLLASTTTVSIYGILEHFGIDENYWVQDVRNRVFSTLGQPNWLAALLVTVTPLAFLFLKNPHNKMPTVTPSSRITYILLSIFYLTLLYTKSRSGFLGFWVMVVTYWFLMFSTSSRKIPGIIPKLLRNRSLNSLKEVGKQHLMTKEVNREDLRKVFQELITITATLLGITFVVGSPFSPSFQDLAKKFTKSVATESANLVRPKIQSGGGTPSEDIRRIVWKGAIDVWRHWPIFGSGVETFAYSYYNFRPIAHNYVSEWDFLYNKAHNEYLNFLATTGSVGLFSYLFLQFSFLNYAIQSFRKTKSPAFAAFASGYFSLSVVNFFGFSTVTDGILSFLFPAFTILLNPKRNNWIEKELGTKNENKLSFIGWITTITVLFLSMSAATEIFIRWYADRAFAKGQDLASGIQISEGLMLEQKASSLVPDEPVFHDQLSLELARSAAALFAEGSTESAKLLASSSAWHSDVVMNINPYHINFLKNRTAAMLHLSIIDPIYKERALETLLHAKALSPTDPKLFFNLGLLYLDKDDGVDARKEFEQSIALKNDYAPPRIELAVLLEQTGELEKAIEQYQYVLDHIDPNHVQAKLGVTRLSAPKLP